MTQARGHGRRREGARRRSVCASPAHQPRLQWRPHARLPPWTPRRTPSRHPPHHRPPQEPPTSRITCAFSTSWSFSSFFSRRSTKGCSSVRMRSTSCRSFSGSLPASSTASSAEGGGRGGLRASEGTREGWGPGQPLRGPVKGRGKGGGRGEGEELSLRALPAVQADAQQARGAPRPPLARTHALAGEHVGQQEGEQVVELDQVVLQRRPRQHQPPARALRRGEDGRGAGALTTAVWGARLRGAPAGRLRRGRARSGRSAAARAPARRAAGGARGWRPHS
jgi:hypothetical protein